MLGVMLGLFAVALIIQRPVDAQGTVLDAFVGKDLWKNRPSEKDQMRLERFLGKVAKGYWMEPAPWHVWKTITNAQVRYIVLLGEPEIMIPGGSSASVQLFDVTGRRIGNWCFQTGWRMDLRSASFEFSSNLGNSAIILGLARFINGRNIAKEIFTINNDKFRFVRMESDKGEVVQNEYVFPNYEIGVVPDVSGVDQWVSMLESKDNADVLSALMFLGGRHLTEPRRQMVDGPKESKYAALFQQLVDDPRIHELIEQLSHSENEWVRQAAGLAARGPRERLLQ